MHEISNLPDEILCHIGSFLSAKEAAFAMVLSRRWKNMFNIIPELHFEWSDSHGNGGDIDDFVAGVLALPVTTRVRKLSLSIVYWWCNNNVTVQYDLINRCLLHVLKLGVMDLNLKVYDKERRYTLPLEVFTCKTVANLTLGFCFDIDSVPADAYLPSLKTLCLDSIRFYEFGRCAFNAFLSASPVLEELVIRDIDWERWKSSFTVSSPTLRRLTMERRSCSYVGEYPYFANIALDARSLAYEFDSLSLDTPALTYLEYADFVPKQCPIVNLNSLVEVKLDFRADRNRVWEKINADNFDPMTLFNKLKHVEILDLDNFTMEMIYLFDEAIPVFENLLRVSVKVNNICWISLTILLKKSPNLKTLIIEDRSRRYRFLYSYNEDARKCVSDNSFLSSSCPLEVLKITRFDGTLEDFRQMKHILEALPCLETVEVHFRRRNETEMKEMAADLQMIPRASSKCKIHFFHEQKRFYPCSSKKRRRRFYL